MFPSDKGLLLQISELIKNWWPICIITSLIIPNYLKIKSTWHNRVQVPLEIFLPQNFMQPLSRLCQGALCSAVIDKGKREVHIISPLSYYFFFLISSHELLFLYSISLTTCKRRGKVRSKNGLNMTAEMHVSNSGKAIS